MHPCSEDRSVKLQKGSTDLLPSICETQATLSIYFFQVLCIDLNSVYKLQSDQSDANVHAGTVILEKRQWYLSCYLLLIKVWLKF